MDENGAIAAGVYDAPISAPAKGAQRIPSHDDEAAEPRENYNFIVRDLGDGADGRADANQSCALE